MAIGNPSRIAGPLAKHVLGTRKPNKVDFDKPKRPGYPPRMAILRTVTRAAGKK